MSKHQTFMVKATSGREGVMRLPVGKYGALTTKAFKMIRQRFYEGATDTEHGLQYAVNLEAYTNADDLIKALQNYKENKL